MALLGAACLVPSGAALADGITNAGDDLRTGWYPDAGSITPQIVTGGTFGQLWSTPVDGQVYAQPLLAPTGTLIVATENDKVYGLDPATGAPQWNADLGTPWNPADIGCGDITPSIGTTATPVIDPSTNTVYLTHKTYVSGVPAWFMDALDATNGHERPGFPVQLSGSADNAPSVAFVAKDQQQRPGLLLMNGVVYAGFGSHCDVQPFEGWVFGVSTAGRITARWASVSTTNGGGVWQSGVGLASDGAGSILLATGNGGAPSTPAAGSSPPASCGECVIRLHVQPDGSLAPVDFFAPFDAAQLDQFDADFGSGGVVGLPGQSFGTTALPHLAVAVGKQGYVYLLNRDNLGGYDQGPGGGDGVVQRIGPNGGVWGRPGVWPGDGGYVYIATSSGQGSGGLFDAYKYGLSGSGGPSLSLAGSSSDVFGWGSGSPVITSDGTTSGSAIVWIIWSANRQGSGGQLRAYDPVPAGGQLQPIYSAAIGNATNYSTPGVGAGRLYVGTRDGRVLAFGSPVSAPLSGSSLSFPRTTTGSTSGPQTLMLTANRNLTVSSLTSSASEFSLGTPSRALPATLTAGQAISVPVSFTPTQWGVAGAQLTAATDAGDVSFSLTGTGQVPGGQLVVNPSILSLGGVAVGGHLSGTATLNNIGAQSVTIRAVRLPGAPFSATGAPAAGDTIASGASVTINVSFDPTAVGSFTDALGLDDSGGSETIGLSASAATPGHLRFSAGTLEFNGIEVGSSASQTFTITNVGGSAVTITRSKPPFGGPFAASTTLAEGATIGPGQSLSESVRFAPTSPGIATGSWQINSDDGTGAHEVQLTGIGTSAAASAGGTAPGASGPAAPTGARPSALSPRAPKFVPALATTSRLARVYITYAAAVAGVSRFVFERATTGRRGARGCVARTARNRSRARCTRFVVLATFLHRDHVGENKLRLLAFVAARQLAPGTYRLRSRLPTAAAGNLASATTLRILAPPAPHRARSPRALASLAGVLRLLTQMLGPLA